MPVCCMIVYILGSTAPKLAKNLSPSRSALQSTSPGYAAVGGLLVSATRKPSASRRCFSAFAPRNTNVRFSPKWNICISAWSETGFCSRSSGSMVKQETPNFSKALRSPGIFPKPQRASLSPAANAVFQQNYPLLHTCIKCLPHVLYA